MAMVYATAEDAMALVEAEWRRRTNAEAQGSFVVMPPLDPPPVPPEFLPEAEGRDALVAARQNVLAGLLEDWRQRRGVGGG